MDEQGVLYPSLFQGPFSNTLSVLDQEWLDAVNAERKKEQIDMVTYETFEIIMDRLEKEWFDLVRLVSFLYDKKG